MRKAVVVLAIVGVVLMSASASWALWSNRKLQARVLSQHVTHYGSAGDSVEGNIKIRNKTDKKRYVTCKVAALNKKKKGIGSSNVFEIVPAHKARRESYAIFPNSSQRIKGIKMKKCWINY